MKVIGPKTIMEITRKLRKNGDIGKEEAEKIIRLVRSGSSMLGKIRSGADTDLISVLCDWYDEVAKRLPEYGNYVHTIPLSVIHYREDLEKTIDVCLNTLSPLDKVSYLRVSANFPIKKQSLKTCTYCSDMAGMLRETDVYDVLKAYTPILEGERAESSMNTVIFRKEYLSRAYAYEPNIRTNAELIYDSVLLRVVHSLSIPWAFVRTDTDRDRKVFVDEARRLEPVMSCSLEDMLEEAVSLRLITKNDFKLLLDGDHGRDEMLLSDREFDSIVGGLAHVFAEKCQTVQEETEWMTDR
mgnify:CR=1 FL=1